MNHMNREELLDDGAKLRISRTPHPGMHPRSWRTSTAWAARASFSAMEKGSWEGPVEDQARSLEDQQGNWLADFMPQR